MSDAILDQKLGEKAHQSGVNRTTAIAVVSVGLLLAAMLWWRFGNSVFAASMMNAFMACF